jgi:E3 SUMO-protein ligase PIAS1
MIMKGLPFLTSSSYVKDILEKTPKSQETVTIEPNGEWHLKSTDDSSQGHTNGDSSYTNAFDDDDDDLVISEVNSIGHRRLETPKISTPISTPVTAGRDVSSSAGPRGIASTSAKRPVAAVIDLTLSDDDDDDPPPPPKRQNTSMNGYSGNLPNNSPISPGDLGYL